MPTDAAAAGLATDSVTVRAFGQRLDLRAPPHEFLRDDTLWRLREIYEPALAAQTLAPEGTAVDVGAGFGGFALPFARAFPGWTVWAFEPDPQAFAALRANISALALTNVVALPVAVGAGTPETATAIDPMRLGAALEAGDGTTLAALCPPAPHARSLDRPGFLQAGAEVPDGFEGCALPTLPAWVLAGLEPALLKLTAPQAEDAILSALSEVAVDHILGELWGRPPARLVHDAPGRRRCWLPVAGVPMLALRRGEDISGRRPGLDVVVAMYNARAWIGDCLDGLLARSDPALRVLVVDDGSTDGSGELVAARGAEDARVSLLPKANGGCASARNYGRLLSHAAHIAFVDADDVPGPDLFPELLELARYTGAEVVQGGFEALHADSDGALRAVPSYETDTPAFAALTRRRFGTGQCFTVPAAVLIEGQPTIWRRVYRRDFLDSRNIWFPEHIRAFDDQIFQLLTLHHARNVPMLDHVFYGYRQHPGQDIRQGDARGFYSLEMFRMILKRALAEGWNDLGPVLRSYVNTVNWTHAGLRPDLRPLFAITALELWVIMRKALGPAAFADLPDDLLDLPDRDHHLARLRRRLAGLGDSYAWGYLDSIDMHVPAIRAREANGTLRRP